MLLMIVTTAATVLTIKTRHPFFNLVKSLFNGVCEFYNEVTANYLTPDEEALTKGGFVLLPTEQLCYGRDGLIFHYNYENLKWNLYVSVSKQYKSKKYNLNDKASQLAKIEIVRGQIAVYGTEYFINELSRHIQHEAKILLFISDCVYLDSTPREEIKDCCKCPACYIPDDHG